MVATRERQRRQPPSHQQRRPSFVTLSRRACALLVCALTIVVGAACTYPPTAKTVARNIPQHDTSSAALPHTSEAPLTSEDPLPEPPVEPVSIEPESIEIPKIGAQSSLIPMGLNPDGSVEVPPDDQPKQAGWFSEGPAPGDQGAAVIVGHFDGHKQEGIFYQLRKLVPGDLILVKLKDGTTVRFTAQRSERVPKSTFPTEAVYGETPNAELRLITCAGSFDRAAQSYRDNLIVYAVLDSASPINSQPAATTSAGPGAPVRR